MQLISSRNNILGKILVFILLFSFIYEIHFAYLPLNFPVIFGVIAFLVYVLSKKVRTKCKSNGWQPAKLLAIFLPVLIFSFISIVLNQSWDFYFVKWYIFFVLKVFACMLIMLLTKKYFGDLHYITLIKLFFLCAIIQVGLSIIIWVLPDIKELLYMTLTLGDIGEEALDRTSGLRLNGYGTNFFGAGTIHGFILFSTALLLQSRLKFLKSTTVIILYIVVFIVSMMMARTTIIGFALAMLLLVLINKPKFNVLKLITYTVLSCIISIAILGSLSPQFLEKFNYVITFGFEMFINYFNGDGLTTSSISNSMVDMYKFPDNIFTWVVGDGYWENPITGYYYKGTDIGYCRMLFYFGAFGLLVFYLCYLKLFKTIRARNTGIPRIYLQLLFIYFATLHLKGFTDLLPLILPLYFCDTLNKPIASHEYNSL